VTARLYLRYYGAEDRLERRYGPEVTLTPGESHLLEWAIGETGGAPIAEVGLELASEVRADGVVYLDYLTWEGVPEVAFGRPEWGGTMWRRAWVDGVDHAGHWYPEPYRLIQDSGTGLLIQGTREWRDYRVSADVTPHMAKAAGIAARVQGMRRYYALLLSDSRKAQLVKALDGQRVLAEADLAWKFGETHDLALAVEGARLRGWVDGEQLFDLVDGERPLDTGGIALVCQEGRTATQVVRVAPIP
jgi:hypothetical protein